MNVLGLSVKMSQNKSVMEVNKDLVMERAKCTFNILEVTHIIDGGEQNTLQRKKIGKLSFKLDFIIYYLADVLFDPNLMMIVTILLISSPG